MIAGISTLKRVVLAITTGTTIPQNATNFFNPLLCKNAFVQTVKTKVFTQSCRHPASILELTKKFVKFATTKNKKPVSPEIAIHFEFFMLPPFEFDFTRITSFLYQHNFYILLTQYIIGI